MKKNEVTIYRFDEHNRAFYFWQKARLEGLIKAPLDLFHVDAHADMGRPSTFRNSLYALRGINALNYYEKFSQEELNIQNFIYPAVLNGLVRNVYFFYPPWRNYKPTRARMRIGSAFGEGQVITYPGRPDGKKHQATAQKALPDLKTFSYMAGPIQRMPQRSNVILDIDLDYFACRDSAQNDWRYRLEITPEQYRKRKAILQDGTLHFSGLEFTFKKERQQPIAYISFRSIPEKMHLPGHEEIRRAVDSLVQTLATRNIWPAIITLCRSTLSGYCPDAYARFIEAFLMSKLEGIYPLKKSD